jgi:hypothetical protein
MVIDPSGAALRPSRSPMAKRLMGLATWKPSGVGRAREMRGIAARRVWVVPPSVRGGASRWRGTLGAPHAACSTLLLEARLSGRVQFLASQPSKHRRRHHRSVTRATAALAPCPATSAGHLRHTCGSVGSACRGGDGHVLEGASKPKTPASCVPGARPTTPRPNARGGRAWRQPRGPARGRPRGPPSSLVAGAAHMVTDQNAPTGGASPFLKVSVYLLGDATGLPAASVMRKG